MSTLDAKSVIQSNSISKAFREEFFFERLQHRKETFFKIIEYLEQFQWGEIIETGTLRIKNNFEGDGQSTFLWDWFLGKTGTWEAHSVDISPEAVAISKEHCPKVNVHLSDSLAFLDTKDVSGCVLLYLDSFDWAPEIHLDSCFHHMAELATVYAKLPTGCLIVVDDKHNEQMGKHFMVQCFFEKLGVEPYFNGYQIGWIKP